MSLFVLSYAQTLLTRTSKMSLILNVLMEISIIEGDPQTLPQIRIDDVASKMLPNIFNGSTRTIKKLLPLNLDIAPDLTSRRSWKHFIRLQQSLYECTGCITQPASALGLNLIKVDTFLLLILFQDSPHTIAPSSGSCLGHLDLLGDSE
jgi:hypothetical protein